MIRTDGETYGEYLSVRLPRPVDEALRRRAAETGQSRSEIVRAALANQLIRTPSEASNI
jgi:Arc/MetJ-type ribon-helix-helix transcriptional regulator